MLTGCYSKPAAQRGIRIAVLTYDEYDTLVEGMTKYMTKWCRQKEKETGVRITIDVAGAGKSQLAQNMRSCFARVSLVAEPDYRKR